MCTHDSALLLLFFCVVGEGFPPSTRSVYYIAAFCNLVHTVNIYILHIISPCFDTSRIPTVTIYGGT